jgi:mono/diheme cytochrome c family protein
MLWAMRWPVVISLLLLPTAALPTEPAAPPPDLPTDGAVLYGQYCSKCHGDDGAGKKLGKGRGKKMPDFSSAAWQAKTKDDDIRKIIEYGGPKNLNMGKAVFKIAYEPQILAIIGYVRGLPNLGKPAPEAPASTN